jgi:hypothetical protein
MIKFLNLLGGTKKNHKKNLRITSAPETFQSQAYSVTTTPTGLIFSRLKQTSFLKVL